MEDFLVRKIYIDSRFKTDSSVSDSNFSIVLPEAVNLPEKCIGVIDEIILPVMFCNVQTGVNDKLYMAIFHSAVTNYYTITLAERNYDLIELGNVISDAINLLDPTNVSFFCGGIPEEVRLSIKNG
jgi:hypothetical protein